MGIWGRQYIIFHDCRELWDAEAVGREGDWGMLDDIGREGDWGMLEDIGRVGNWDRH